MKEQVAEWRLYVNCRLSYWKFALRICEELGLGDAAHCAWKVAEFEELSECIAAMARAAA